MQRVSLQNPSAKNRDTECQFLLDKSKSSCKAQFPFQDMLFPGHGVQNSGFA